MHSSQHRLCARKMNLHSRWNVISTFTADQRKWRRMRISAASSTAGSWRETAAGKGWLHAIYMLWPTTWPSLAFSCVKNLAFHSLLRWKMVTLPIFLCINYTFLLKRSVECTFWTWEWKVSVCAESVSSSFFLSCFCNSRKIYRRSSKFHVECRSVFLVIFKVKFTCHAVNSPIEHLDSRRRNPMEARTLHSHIQQANLLHFSKPSGPCQPSVP